MDIEGDIGDSVIASAPGRIVSVEFDSESGFEVVIAHEGLPPDRESLGAMYHTSYIHLRHSSVRVDERVRRGQKIGEVGEFWASGGVPHVHWRLCRGRCRSETTLDPLLRGAGCFSASRKYPEDRIVITYPLRC
ncbi:MAG: M23 family metallopeptidase [Deltaproteobacteria bacterium]|nr:M23 family metallopeptidase [Deltaproteobacteria bacterium]